MKVKNTALTILPTLFTTLLFLLTWCDIRCTGMMRWKSTISDPEPPCLPSATRKLLLSLLVNQALDPGINQKIREIENGHSIVPHLIRRDTELNRKLTPYLLELIENQFRSYTDFQMGVIGCLFLIFQILIRYAVEADRNADEYRMDFSKVKPAIDAVINHYEQKISITTAAEKCCLSESHFMKMTG